MRAVAVLVPWLFACGGSADADADTTKKYPPELHRYVVDSVAKTSLAMHVEGCPSSKATAEWSDRVYRDPHGTPTDFACLAKIRAGKTIVYSVQMFENPKLEPKRMIVRRLDGCSATDVQITPDFVPCANRKP